MEIVNELLKSTGQASVFKPFGCVYAVFMITLRKMAIFEVIESLVYYNSKTETTQFVTQECFHYYFIKNYNSKGAKLKSLLPICGFAR